MELPRVGDALGGKYVILRLVGAGGMGAVFEAENKLTHKRVAIKWLHPELSMETGSAARLIREAQAASRIRHPNVVDVYDIEREGSTIFLVMELLDGETLTQALARHDLPAHALIALMLPAMRGVAAAHKQGVIHRDVKPDNIFLAREDDAASPVAKVLDFGISKVEERGRSQPSLTRTGNTVGTPLYMSYEQLAGDRALDGRADVYAFGVILYEALTGRLPFEASTLAKLVVLIATQPPVSPKELRADLPTSLSNLIMRAIARHRDDRIPSMEALIQELAPFATEGGYKAEFARACDPEPRATTPLESMPAPPLPPSVMPISSRPEHAQRGPLREAAERALAVKNTEPAAEQRPFPFLGRTQRRVRFQPPEEGASRELPAQNVATPLRSTLTKLRESARPHKKMPWLAATGLVAAGALWFAYPRLIPVESAAREGRDAPGASAEQNQPPAQQPPNARKTEPSLPTTPSTRSSDLNAEDWTPDRRVQLVTSDETIALPDAGSVLPVPQVPTTDLAEARAKPAAEAASRPHKSQGTRRDLAATKSTSAAVASEPSGHASTPETLQKEPAAQVRDAAVEHVGNPFRVRPPRAEDF